MSIEFDCETCGKHFMVADAMAGKRAKCKGCGGVIQIPRREEGPPDLWSLETANAGAESPAPFELAKPRMSHVKTAAASGNEKEIKWWIMILAGVGFIPLAIYEYNDLRKWETAGGTRYLDSLTSLAYRVFGTTGVLVLLLSLSALLIGGGILIRVLERKKPRQNSSPLKDVVDAAIALQAPISKLVLIGLLVVNLFLISAALGLFGLDGYDIKKWFLSIFFGALALSLAEWSLWDRLVQKFDKHHKPDTRLQVGGIIISLLMGIGFGYQTHSEARQVIDQQKTDASQAAMRRQNDRIKDFGPAMERIRELQTERANTLTRPVPTATPQSEPTLPDEPGPAWQPDPEQLARLGPEATIGAYAVRPPVGFALQAQLQKGNYRWVSARGMFMINVTDQREGGFHPPIVTVANRMAPGPLQQTFIGATREIGTIGGIAFVRAFKAGSRKGLYAAYDGDKLIVISCLVKDPADLAICDAAAKTLHGKP
ncbi:MAG TPA: hypothetical protein VFC46_01295 [Humisphaera sp.]|nr:hypothetical protein [Humisphaera sp.]